MKDKTRSEKDAEAKRRNQKRSKETKINERTFDYTVDKREEKFIIINKQFVEPLMLRWRCRKAG